LTAIIEAVENFMLGLFLGNAFWAVLFVAVLPILEVRGAVLFGKALLEKGYSISNFEIFLASYLGAMIVVPIILLCLNPIINRLKKTKLFSKMAHKLEIRFKRKGEKIQSRKNDIYKMLGIVILVAIPIPGTGSWMSSAVAVFIGLGFLRSLISIAIGNLISTAIMMLVADVLKEHLEIVLLVFFILVVIALLYLIYEMFIKKAKTNDIKTADVKDNYNRNFVNPKGLK